MKFTVVAEDKTVYVDGKAQVLDDVSILPGDVHAVQWDGNRGEIEFFSKVCDHCGSVSKKPNVVITDISPYQSLVDAHAKKTAENAAKLAADQNEAQTNAP